MHVKWGINIHLLEMLANYFPFITSDKYRWIHDVYEIVINFC